MRKRMIVCDICGADITRDSRRFRFQAYDDGFTIDQNGKEHRNHERLKFLNWKRADMCLICMMELGRFAKEKMK